MITRIIGYFFIVLLASCANPEYSEYLKVTASVEAAKDTARSEEAIARYNAEAAKYKAMSDIAANGDQTAKVAAVMAMALGNQIQPANTGGSAPRTQIQAPPTNQALQWASILVPSITQIVGMNYNMRMAETQSNNARDVAVSTNSAFSGMASNIRDTATTGFAANQGIASSGFTATTNIATAGLTAATNVSTAGFTATTGIASSGFTAANGLGTSMANLGSNGFTALTNSQLASATGMATIAGLIQAPAASVTTNITGDGVVGSGAMTKTDSHNTSTTTSNTTTSTDSHNTANPVTTTNDNHSVDNHQVTPSVVCTNASGSVVSGPAGGTGASAITCK